MDRQTLQQMIGRVLMVGIPGAELDEATAATLRRLQIGGVILFRRNVGTPVQLAALTAALHALPSRPLVSIDHEGGRVMRLGAPFTAFPSMAVVGATGDSAIAQQVGRAMGAELSAVGIDLDFAPVLDVHSNPANPVIGDRSFSHDPSIVATMGVALMRGLHEGGVLSCGKHFPGHGDTDSDSHLTLPVVRRTRAELDLIELPPFRAAIAAGVPLLLTAHVLYPALDPHRPATLSPVILRDLLRTELGFSGVIASDDLEMRAISGHHDVGDAAVATLNAGADLLLVCNDFTKAEVATAAIERAVIDGALSTDVVESAAGRVNRLTKAHRSSISLADLPIAEHGALAARLRA
jgi:beta-N-acetylhexosaminidase